MSYDVIAKLLLEGKSCKGCLYASNRGFKFVCEKMIAIGGSAQPLPKEQICHEWTQSEA